MALRQQLGLPARLHHHGAGALDNDRRPVQRVARAQRVALHYRRIVPGAGHIGADGGKLRHAAHAVHLRHHRGRCGYCLAGTDRLHRKGRRNQRLFRCDKAEALAMRRLERHPDFIQRAERHQQRGVRAGIAQVQLALHRDTRLRHALRRHVGPRLCREFVEAGGEAGQGGVVQFGFHCRLAQQALVGQAHAIGREHAGMRVQQHPGHAQGIGHQAGMLPTGAAERGQRVFRHVVAARHGNLLDRVRHIVDRDGEKAFGHRLGASCVAVLPRDVGGECGELRAHHGGVEWRIAAGAEHPGEEVRVQLAQHDVAIRHRQRPAAAIAGRARIGSGAVGPNAIARAVEMQDRTAAGRYRVDQHHRRAHAHPGHHGLEGALVFAVEVAHVGTGAAHVEADDLAKARLGRGFHHADHAAGRARQDGILALEKPRVGQPAVRLHEQKPRIAEMRGHLVHIAAQDRPDIGIDDSGVATADQLHQRAYRMAG